MGVLERRAKTKSIKKDLVFFSSHGTKLDNSNLVRAFKEALRKAKISDFTWHGLRRTFATRLAHKGLDIYKISRLLGHADVQTTQKRYAHHCTESLRIGVDILDPDYVLTTFGEKEGFLGNLGFAVSYWGVTNWGTRIRTRTNRTRIYRATITLYPIGLLFYFIYIQYQHKNLQFK